eukprot:CAMPEP_0178991378 /NCGR_PEP_ID=MMETSP0795-20121207/5492_1 /TAXON_ID=88552 /ORGANISM="Amoebophrya sp., Strain Ameob2" /LENGTH=93 /DNA_ID=CAMNT_0020683075 /DNA_START=89 /DNA_END=370 /DNA_ORIENTATION=+
MGASQSHSATATSLLQAPVSRHRTTSFLGDDLLNSAAQSAREASLAAESAAQAAKVALAEVAVARQASGNARKQIHYLKTAMEGPSGAAAIGG